MWAQILKWLYENSMAIFISTIASLLISKKYYDKANRESVLMMVIFPIVKLLSQKEYTRKNYEVLLEITSSYAVKFLRKKERNKLIELLCAYRDVYRYSKEASDTSSIMSYFNYKLRENGVNPKPNILEIDGEVVEDDFLPEYDYLQDYIYKIVSSNDFMCDPDDCTAQISNAFERYVKRYYSAEKNIVYFEDYTIEQVIELSEISKKWNEKFKSLDVRREEFFELPICKKVKDIIDASSSSLL